MSLPVVQVPTQDVALSDGQTVTVRALTRGQVLEFVQYQDDQVQAEIHVLAWATGASVEEATEWHQATPWADVNEVVNSVLSLSGLTDLGKGSSEG